MLGDQQHRLMSVIVLNAISSLLGLLDLAKASPTVRRGRRPGGPGTLAEQSGPH
jgi:hypothetical protein